MRRPPPTASGATTRDRLSAEYLERPFGSFGEAATGQPPAAPTVPLATPTFPAPDWSQEATEARDERERREQDRRRPGKRRDFPQVEGGVRYPPFRGMASIDMAEIKEGGGA